MHATQRQQLGNALVMLVLWLTLPRPACSAQDPAHVFSPKARGNPLANDPRRVERSGVSIVVEALDASRSEDVFGVDLLRRNIQPLVVKVYNGSPQAYHFRKADVQPSLVPAATVAHLLQDPLWMRGAQAGKESISAVPRIVFPHVNKQTTRVAGRENVQANLLKDELADGAIAPKQFVNGFLFIPTTPTPLTLTLTNVSTHTPLVVSIPRSAEHGS